MSTPSTFNEFSSLTKGWALEVIGCIVTSARGVATVLCILRSNWLVNDLLHCIPSLFKMDAICNNSLKMECDRLLTPLAMKLLHNLREILQMLDLIPFQKVLKLLGKCDFEISWPWNLPSFMEKTPLFCIFIFLFISSSLEGLSNPFLTFRMKDLSLMPSFFGLHSKLMEKKD